MNTTEALKHAYGNGLADGMAMTLRAVLGHTVYRADIYHGPLPDELKEWANEALERMKKAGVSAASEELVTGQ